MQKNTSITLGQHFDAFIAEQLKMADTAQPARSFVPHCACLKSLKPA